MLRALNGMGLAVTAERQDKNAPPGDTGPVCFEIPSHYEISAGGRKLIGSAQLRRKGGLLQHGSLPLKGDLARICGVLRFETDEARDEHKTRVRERALTLSDIVAEAVTWSDAASAIESGFASAFDLEMNAARLSPAELRRAEELIAERFGNNAWTRKR